MKKETEMSAKKVVKQPKPKLMNIKLEKLHPFESHPYKVLDDVSMTELVESIKEYGLLNRIIVRPLEDKQDEYEIISGHRRVHAAEILEMKEVPAVVHFIDRDQATILMVDSNCQRENLSLMEKARSYRMKLDAIKHQGTSRQNVEKSEVSAELISENDSGRTVQRLIRLTYLVPELQEFVDSGKMKMLPAYELSFLNEEAQRDVIDPEAAEVVKSIFKMCLEGKGNETIARILQEKQVLVPMAYWQSKGLPRGGKKTQPNPYKWCKTTIQKILSQQEYCGDVINFKTCSKSFKNKTRLPNDPENWAIFKDVHEPIIARSDFEKVRALIAKTKRRAPKPKNGEKSIFCDLLFCGDCHGKLRHHTNTINKDIHYFVCANNKVDYRGECPGRHYVRADAIEQVIMLELQRMAEFLVADEEAFAELLAQKTDKELLKEKKHDEAELQKAIARNDTVSHLYEKLYEDNAVGKVSDEWFMQLSHKYETERLELKTKIKALRQKLSECGQREQERKNFTSAIRRFMRMDRLTAPLLRELIDHIDVFETEGKGKNRTQRIVIYYRFVGYVEIPEVSQRPRIKADTRKGVAVEYLTEPLPA